MNKKEFLLLSKEELFKGVSYSNNSAANHLKAAQLLATNNIFGIANSHLILAAEEGVKAAFFHIRIITFSKKTGIKMFSEERIKNIFSNHKAKHAFVKANYSFFSEILKTIINKVYTFVEKSQIKNKQEELNTIKTVLNFVSKDNNADWWDHADNMKNSGFYVNYKNKWLLPSDISKKEYLKSYPIVGQLLVVTQLLEKFKITNGT